MVTQYLNGTEHRGHSTFLCLYNLYSSDQFLFVTIHFLVCIYVYLSFISMFLFYFFVYFYSHGVFFSIDIVYITDPYA